MKQTTRYSWQHSRMGCGKVSFYYPCTRMTWKLCQMYSTGLSSTWMQKMHYLLVRRSLGREKDRRKPDMIGGERWPERETKGRTNAPNPLQEGSRTSPLWIPRSIKSWCRSKTKGPWHSPASWKEILARGPGINIADYTTITAMTHLNALTWSSR